MYRNTANQVIGVQMVNTADGLAHTTAGVAVSVTVDGGTQTGGAGSGPTHEGNGYWTYIPTVGETNGAHIGFTFTHAGAIPVTVQVYTRTGDAVLPNRRHP